MVKATCQHGLRVLNKHFILTMSVGCIFEPPHVWSLQEIQSSELVAGDLLTCSNILTVWIGLLIKKSPSDSRAACVNKQDCAINTS